MDDDEDNAGTASHTSGDVAEIPLSPFKIQKVRMYARNVDGNIIGSQDITIEKTYIEEKEIDPNSIVFDDITESEKEKIEKLKTILSSLPQQQKLQSLSYVQKLQENWNDNTEKTRTILDFENYIFELWLSNESEIISLLESLLVEWQEDQSAKQITYTALVNLIPENIECEVSGGATCHENLLSKLDDIRGSSDVEANKVLGKEVLEVIGASDLLTNSQKLDFKAILTSLVYGGDVENIPAEEKQEVIDETPTVSDDERGGWGILWVLFTILKWIGYFLWVFLLIIAGLYVMYLILNKNKDIWFSEFVSNITSFWKESTSEDASDVLADTEDILSELNDDASRTSSDILSEAPAKVDQVEGTKEANIPATPESIPASSESTPDPEEVPDWLKGNFENTPEASEIVSTPPATKEKAEKVVEKEVSNAPDTPNIAEASVEKEVVQAWTSDDQVPDWLKWAVDNTKEQKGETPVDTPKNEGVKDVQSIEKTQVLKEPSYNLEEETKLPEADANVPDWLKWSFDTVPEKDDTAKEGKQEKWEIPEIPKQGNVPKTGTQEKKESQEKRETKVVPWVKKDTPKKSPEKKEELPKIEKKWEKKPVEKIAEKQEDNTIKVKKDVTVKEDKKGDIPSPEKTKGLSWWEELWDDGMKIPDWLKTDD